MSDVATSTNQADSLSSDISQAPTLERVPLSFKAAAILSCLATTSLLVLLQPDTSSVAASLFVNTASRDMTLRSTFGLGTGDKRSSLGLKTTLYPSERRAVDLTPNSLHEMKSSSSTTTSTSPQRLAGVALGAALATALSLFNRLRVKGSSVRHSESTALNTAVMDPQTTNQPVEYDRGIVTPEEAVNLPFTMNDLKNAIPRECFEKSLAWSMFYFARDWAIVAALYHFQPAIFSLGILGKLVWWNVVGFYGWCLFVVGHDCGHGTFSNYGWINQLLGHVCHAPLLVPFNAWRISHRHHHQYHNDVDRDHSWRPSPAKSVSELGPHIKKIRFTPLILLAYPYYLMSTSQEDGFSGNHFWPWNPLFKKEERLGVGLSALSVVAFLGGIIAATTQVGFMTMLQLYWIPYLVFVTWLDLVTLMQHTDKNALFFRGSAWNYLRGAMSTVDRTYRHLIDPFNLGYGRVIDHLHHNISNGHVVHHIFFTQIPHYRLMAATEAIKPLLGKHYRYDETPIPKALMTTLNECWFVDDIKDGVVSYRGGKEYQEWEQQQA